jgi:hypothetical protein
MFVLIFCAEGPPEFHLGYFLFIFLFWLELVWLGVRHGLDWGRDSWS